MRTALVRLALAVTIVGSGVAYVTDVEAQTAQAGGTEYAKKMSVNLQDMLQLRKEVESLDPERRQTAEIALDRGIVELNDHEDGQPELYYNFVVDVLNGKRLNPETQAARAQAEAGKKYQRKAKVNAHDLYLARQEAGTLDPERQRIAMIALNQGELELRDPEGGQPEFYYNFVVDVLNGDRLNPETAQQRQAAQAAKKYQRKDKVAEADILALRKEVESLDGERKRISTIALDQAFNEARSPENRESSLMYYNFVVDVLNGDRLAEAR
jgi:hypothetical protein